MDREGRVRREVITVQSLARGERETTGKMEIISVRRLCVRKLSLGESGNCARENIDIVEGGEVELQRSF